MTAIQPKDMIRVVDSLKRGRAGHAYGGVGDRFMLTIGAPKVIAVAGVNGGVVAVGIDREQAKELRASIDLWLSTV